MRALALVLLLLPSIAFAQVAPAPPADPGECTVTTTVRCTGAAAPYAVQAAQPQPPVVIQAPPAAPSPPTTVPQPGAILVDPHLLGDGWRFVQSNDGSLWRERKVSTDAPAVWGAGLALWLGGYGASVIAGMQQGGFNEIGWMPIIGAFVNSAFTEDGTAKGLWAVDGIAQTGGFVMFLVGMAAGPDKIQRLPLTVGPASFIGGGSGVALAAHF
ncbi:MAG: hypothetical protein LC659_04805 [Myxococcales bacterium]|nr:hypothetical protein [Myxococcales bacterium]